MSVKPLDNYAVDDFSQCQTCAFATLRDFSARKLSVCCSQCDDELLVWKLRDCPKYSETDFVRLAHILGSSCTNE